MDGNIKIWNYLTDKCVKTFESHSLGVLCLTVLKDGLLLSGGRDITIKIWNKEYKCIKQLSEHGGIHQCLLTLENGWFVSGSYDSRIKVWNPEEDYICNYTLIGHTDPVNSLRQLPNNDLISISSDHQGTIILWKYSKEFFNEKEIKSGSNGYSLCVFDNNFIASGHADMKIRIWNFITYACINILVGHSSGIFAQVLLSNGNLVTVGTEVIIWKFFKELNDYKEDKRILDSDWLLNTSIL